MSGSPFALPPRASAATVGRLRPRVTVPHLVTSTTLRRLAFLGNHLPRQCGIATFTTDLSGAIAHAFPGLDAFVVAMNDAGRRHEYPERVRLQLADDDRAAYDETAGALNAAEVDVLSVQHEYGIFGGPAGNHVLTLLRAVQAPIVTTLHTILADPNPEQRRTMDELVRLSRRLVVMSTNGAELLQSVHGVPASRIDLIPHGIPTLPGTRRSRKKLGLDDHTLLLTFGLLSPDKGIEHVIDAMPAVLERFPDALYVVLGATHPHVKERHGEAYRTMLQERARSLGVEAAVRFIDRFVPQDELNDYLAAADLYITPYLNAAQTTSGTLAYAVGSGKAVVSTPYSYARDLLSKGRGVLTPWPHLEPGSMGRTLVNILGDDVKRAALKERASQYGRNMRWPDVARTYVKSFERARNEAPWPTEPPKALALPPLDFSHLSLLSDQTGVLQHATYNVPNYDDGYCLDDNARALIVLSNVGPGDAPLPAELALLASRCLAYVRHAFDTKDGRFRNFLSYSRQWVDAPGSEDCHGRAVWALGTVVSKTHEFGHKSLATGLFRHALAQVETFKSPRAWAYVLLGIDAFLQAMPADPQATWIRARLAYRLFELFLRESSADWPWFESRLSYDNARLSEALIVSGHRMGDTPMLAAGLRSLEWLCRLQRAPEGHFSPIGSNGFYDKGGTRATFDQQPLEATAMVAACLLAFRLTGSTLWMNEARRAFDWFLGRNVLSAPLYDVASGACRDGLHEDRPNENRGAESTLSYLLARLDLGHALAPTQPVATPAPTPVSTPESARQ